MLAVEPASWYTCRSWGFYSLDFVTNEHSNDAEMQELIQLREQQQQTSSSSLLALLWKHPRESFIVFTS